jgi:site-specific DNA recombinase
MARPRKVKIAAPAKLAGSARAVIYARVSTPEQEREGFSIPSQMKLLRDYAATNAIRVDGEYIDIETAKRSGRTNFDEMISYLKRNQSVRSILVEKTDRLYRNIRDWVTIDGLGVEIHFIKENTILSDGSRSSEKFMHGIKVLMAKNYIDNLSEETRKGMLEKAQQGIWPSFAPIGYLNVPGPNGKRIIAIDPDLGPLVAKAFEWFATGSFSLKNLATKIRQLGLVYRKSGKPIGVSTLHSMLRNKIYTGSFEWLGKLYSGSHEPLVAWDVWDNVQDVLNGRSVSNVRADPAQFAFTGLMTCGHCGCAMVAEIKKAKYIYYHCSKFKGKCPEKYVRQEVLEEKFSELMRQLTFPNWVFEEVQKVLREGHQAEQRERDEARQRLVAEADRLQQRLDILYSDRVDGRIDVEFYDRMVAQWRDERARCLRDIELLHSADDSYVDNAFEILKLVHNAHLEFAKRPPIEKRRMLNLLLSNCSWANEKLSAKFRQPFDIIAETVVLNGSVDKPKKGKNRPIENWLPE